MKFPMISGREAKNMNVKEAYARMSLNFLNSSYSVEITSALRNAHVWDSQLNQWMFKLMTGSIGKQQFLR